MIDLPCYNNIVKKCQQTARPSSGVFFWQLFGNNLELFWKFYCDIIILSKSDISCPNGLLLNFYWTFFELFLDFFWTFGILVSGLFPCYYSIVKKCKQTGGQLVCFWNVTGTRPEDNRNTNGTKKVEIRTCFGIFTEV